MGTLFCPRDEYDPVRLLEEVGDDGPVRVLQRREPVRPPASVQPDHLGARPTHPERLRRIQRPLIEQSGYGPADKARIIQLFVYWVSNGIVRRHRTPTLRWAWLRANRGSFDVEHTDTGIEIVATGQADWVG
jgi:hypothetical protein